MFSPIDLILSRKDCGNNDFLELTNKLFGGALSILGIKILFHSLGAPHGLVDKSLIGDLTVVFLN